MPESLLLILSWAANQKKIDKIAKIHSPDIIFANITVYGME